MLHSVRVLWLGMLGIDWRIPADKVVLNEKDKRHPILKNANLMFDYSVE